MSLITLRDLIRRHGTRGVLIGVVVLSALVAAHHAGLHNAHAESGPVAAHTATHGDQIPASPSGAIDDLVAVCLAVLPLMLSLLAAAVGWAVLTRRSWLAPRAPSPCSPARVVFCDRRVRAGPSLLCVLRR